MILRSLTFAFRRPLLTIVGGTVLFIVGFTLAMQTKWYHMNFRGADPLISRNERREKAWALWGAIDAYQTTHGHFPTSDQDIVRFDPGVSVYLQAPRWSIDTYSINYEVLGMDERLVLIADPGIDWPGNPASRGETPARMNKWRVWLFNDGAISIGLPGDRDSIVVEWE